MNPIHWIRWKVLIVVAGVTAGVSFFGIGPAARAAINRLGSTGSGARWNVQDIRFNAVAGRLMFSGFRVENLVADHRSIDRNGSGTEHAAQFLESETVAFDLDMTELLRRRYRGEVHMQAPRILIERRSDGCMNVDFGETTPEEAAEPVDWWSEIQKWSQKIREWHNQYREMAETIPQGEVKEKAQELGGARGKSRFRVDYSKRVTFPYQDSARFVATKLVGDALEICFVDNTPAGGARGAVPALKNGRILIENVSDKPRLHAEPIRWTVTGDIAGAPIKLAGTLDERQSKSGDARRPGSYLEFDFEAKELPSEVAQFFVAYSLPLQFDRGKITLAAHVTITDWNELDVRPVFAFHDASVSTRLGAESIAGVSPDVFCRAFNELSTLEIDDLRVTGTIANPKVELGHTVTNMVRRGGKALAKKQIEKGVQMSADRINEAVDKELGKLGANGSLPPEAGKAVDELKKGLGDRLKGLPFGEKTKPTTKK